MTLPEIRQGVRGEGGILTNKEGKRFMFADIPEAYRAQTATDEEGCLSLGPLRVPVERNLRVSVDAQDEHGEPVHVNAEALEARILQHEIDHLDGVLTIDRTSPV